MQAQTMSVRHNFTHNDKQKRVSVIAQSLYLVNLLLLPGIGFLVLAYYFKQHYQKRGSARIHLYRAVQLSIMNGFLLAIVPLIYILLAANFSTALMLTLFYVVCMHTGFVMLGMLNLSRAMVGKIPLF